jgi:hypothetical protein
MAKGNVPTSQSSIILGSEGVIRLTLSMESVLAYLWDGTEDQRRSLLRSGHPGGVLVHHLAGNGKHLVGGNRPKQETHVLPGKESGVFPIAAEYEYGHLGKTRCQFGHEGGTAHAGAVQSDDNEAQFLNEIRLFHQDEGFCRVGRALNGAELALQDGPANVCL